MFIGLVSDTHGVFSEPFKEFFAGVDELWHAGDFGGGEDFAAGIAGFKPLVGVYGNCDGGAFRYMFPRFQYREVEGVRLLMTHIGGSPGHYDAEAARLLDEYRPDVFICGHSHILKVMNDRKRGLLYVNPGAAGLQGWQVVRTALRFKVEGGSVRDMEVFELPRK